MVRPKKEGNLICISVNVTESDYQIDKNLRENRVTRRMIFHMGLMYYKPNNMSASDFRISQIETEIRNDDLKHEERIEKLKHQIKEKTFNHDKIVEEKKREVQAIENHYKNKEEELMNELRKIWTDFRKKADVRQKFWKDSNDIFILLKSRYGIIVTYKELDGLWPKLDKEFGLDRWRYDNIAELKKRAGR